MLPLYFGDYFILHDDLQVDVNKMEAASTNVKVAVRVRPQLARERIEACRICTYVSDDSPQITLGKEEIFFTY